MKIKKSKFAKLLSLALPIAAISVVAPVVLTSCGTTSSTNTPSDGGGSSGGGSTNPSTPSNPTTVVTAAWDTNKSTDSLKINGNTATITLGDNAFDSTDITKASKYADIVTSLTPPSSSAIKSTTIAQDDQASGSAGSSDASSTKTLYSVLSAAITNVDKYTVKISIDNNPISFDYTNDTIGNSFSGKFELTPIDSKIANATTLNFTVNNFNDSNNDNGKLTWDTAAIETAFKAGGDAANKLPDVTPKDNGASAVIDFSTQKNKPTLSQVMVELSNTSITGDELAKFIKNGDDTNYKLSDAQISNWAPTVDQKTVFTRIVIPSVDKTKEAIMYIAYTGFTVDYGNAAWNRNIAYNSKDVSGDIWDAKYNEPVINLTEEKLWNTEISSSSKATDIKTVNKDIVSYIAENYILGFKNFNLDTTQDQVTVGKFDAEGNFSANAQQPAVALASSKASNDSIIKGNDNVIQIRFLLKLKDGQSEPKGIDGKTLEGFNTNNNGFWKAFYITGYTSEKA